MIICAGLSPAWQETLVFQDLRLGEVNRAREVHWCASGKVLNAARAVHRMGKGRGKEVACRALTVLGGQSGGAVERSLAAEGMEAAFVPTVAPTRVCNTVINLADGSITEMVENAGPLSPEELEEFRALLRREAEGARAVLLMGSLSAGAPAGYYRSLMEGISAPVVLDARGPELIEALKMGPLLVKPNREELSRTAGRPIAEEADLRAGMLELAGRGARWVLVSQGRDVVWVHGEGKFWRFRPPRVETVNPIGSGDCMAGGIAHAIASGADMIEAIRTGIACAAENAGVLLPADIDPARVELRLAEVSVEAA